MPAQLVTRIPDELAADIDELVRSGIYSSRSEAVRAGLVAVVDRERRQRVAREIVEGYRRVPQHADDLEWRDVATRAMIAEEPW